MFKDIAHIPGKFPDKPGLLARYLPPHPEGIAATWLQNNLDPNSWILDPFGASPLLPIEIARAGYRVLVTANNPVARFLIELAANPPREEELSNALAYLAASRKGHERLEPHVKNLYATTCDQCQREVIASSFIWEHSASAPYAKVYHCPYCGDNGERPVTQQDEINAKRFAQGGLHRARALERIAPMDHPDRPHAEEALSVYMPRAIYALFSLINKLESLQTELSPNSPISSQTKRNLDALLLAAFDRANTLWSYPTARERPKQLTVPPRFRETNVWTALEQAIERLSSDHSPVPLTIWPELPPQKGGITIFEGRLKDLHTQYRHHPEKKIDFEATLAAFPRPNQAFWTLSALWAGWLWGREAIGPFRSVLRRRRYDWSWHTTALQAAISQLSKLLPKHARFFGLIAEAEPGFISAAILATGLADLDVTGISLRADSALAQILWQQSSPPKVQSSSASSNSREPSTTPEKSTHFANLISKSARQYLQSRGEPSVYLNLHTDGLISLIQDDQFRQLDSSPTEAYAQTQDSLEEAFTYRKGFLRYGGSDKTLEVGQWWLQDTPQATLGGQALSDRVEKFVSQYLLNHQDCTLLEIDNAVCKLMRGLLTPNVELIKECLRSYGEQNPENGKWRLRPEDAAKVREQDLLTMRMSLVKIGKHLGYQVSGENPILWLNPEDKGSEEVDGGIAYVFYLTHTAIFRDYLFNNPHPADKSLLVYPGGRSNLVVYKMRHDARIKQTFAKGWRLIKFRLLRRLAENPLISRDNFDEQLTLDPVMEDAPQMRLL